MLGTLTSRRVSTNKLDVIGTLKTSFFLNFPYLKSTLNWDKHENIFDKINYDFCCNSIRGLIVMTSKLHQTLIVAITKRGAIFNHFESF